MWLTIKIPNESFHSQNVFYLYVVLCNIPDYSGIVLTFWDSVISNPKLFQFKLLLFVFYSGSKVRGNRTLWILLDDG